MKDTRTINSIKNSIVSIVAYIAPIIFSFISQAVFIRVLNVEYNGIRGLFSNILSMLSVAELGFGSAIVYHLYEPMEKNDYKKIRILVKFYRNVYNIIATVIFILGIIIVPIIPNIVGEVSISENLRLLFLLYLLDTVFSYLLTYKRSILYADQKEYIIKLIDCIFSIIRTVLQIIALIYTRNFMIYLLIQIVFPIMENITINVFINRKYKFIKDLNSTENISKELKNDIILKVKGLLFHRLGHFIVTGTDNIIVSMVKELGITVIGVYSNYNMIIHRVTTVFSNVITSLTASVGNLLIENNETKAKNTYKSMLLINAWIFCFACTTVLCMIEPFIKIWLGSEYILERIVLYTLIINMFLQGLKKTNTTFKEAAGIFYEDRFMPIIEALINLFSSIVLLKIFGLAGVFMGTIVSTMFLFIYCYPKYVFKLILNGSYSEYFKLYLKYTVLSTVICIITVNISNYVLIKNVYFELAIKGIICLVVTNVLYFIVVRKFSEFKFYDDKIKNLLKVRIKKGE